MLHWFTGSVAEVRRATALGPGRRAGLRHRRRDDPPGAGSGAVGARRRLISNAQRETPTAALGRTAGQSRNPCSILAQAQARGDLKAALTRPD